MTHDRREGQLHWTKLTSCFKNLNVLQSRSCSHFELIVLLACPRKGAFFIIIISLVYFYLFAWKLFRCSPLRILMGSESAGCILLWLASTHRGTFVSHICFSSSWFFISPAPQVVQGEMKYQPSIKLWERAENIVVAFSLVEVGDETTNTGYLMTSFCFTETNWLSSQLVKCCYLLSKSINEHLLDDRKKTWAEQASGSLAH